MYTAFNTHTLSETAPARLTLGALFDVLHEQPGAWHLMDDYMVYHDFSHILTGDLRLIQEREPYADFCQFAWFPESVKTMPSAVELHEVSQRALRDMQKPSDFVDAIRRELGDGPLTDIYMRATMNKMFFRSYRGQSVSTFSKDELMRMPIENFGMRLSEIRDGLPYLRDLTDVERGKMLLSRRGFSIPGLNA